MALLGAIRRLLKWAVYGLACLLGVTVSMLLFSYLVYVDWRAERLEALEVRSTVVETAKGPVEYTMRGESGPLTLFVHGRPGGYDSAPRAPEHGRVLTPSRPGYLRTPLAVGVSPAEQAQAYAALLDALEITEPLIVMGASAGGPSAIEFVASFPQRSAALVLVEPLSQPRSDGNRPFFLRNDFSVWLMFRAVELLRGPEGLVEMVIPDPANRNLILTDAARTEEFGALVWTMWPVSRRNAGWDSDTEQFRAFSLPLDAITVPTLIMHGTADVNAPFADSQTLAKQIPHAHFHAIEGADHMMPFTHREELRLVQQSFLSKLALDGR